MSTSRLLTVARREFAAQVQSPPFWVLLVVLMLLVSTIGPLVMVPVADTVIGGERAVEHSAHALASSMSLAAFFGYPFLVAFMSGLSVIRDDDTGMTELTRSTPLTNAEYTLGKLLGVMGVLCLAMVVHLLLTLAFREYAALVGGPAASPVGRLLNYVRPMVLIVAPSVWFTAAVAFVIGARVRRPMAVYAFSIALFWVSIRFLWTWAPGWLPPVADQALMVFDPSGLRWVARSLFAEDLGVSYYNSAPVAWNALFWLGRTATVALPALLLLLHIRAGDARIGVRSVAAAGVQGGILGRLRDWLHDWLRDRIPDRLRTGGSTHTGAATPAASPNFGGLTALAMRNAPRALLSGGAAVFRAELREIRGRPSLWFFALLLWFVVAEVGVAGDDAYGVPVALTAGDFAVRTIPVVTVLVCLYLLFAVVELMYRDQATRFEPIAHATPVSAAALLAGRAGAMLVVILGLMIGCGLSAAVLLAAQTGMVPELGPLALVFGVVLLPTFLLWTTFMMSVMTAVRHRTAGLGVGLLALLATGGLFLSGAMTWATNWPLWAALRWSDMGTFPLNGSALLLNRIAALALAVCFAAVALASFRRIEPDAMARASRRSTRRVVRRGLQLLPFALSPVLVTAFLAIQVEQGWQGRGAVAAADAYWDTNVAQWANAPVPTIESVDASLALEPDEHTLAVSGSYDMRNASGRALSRLAFTIDDAVGVAQFSLNGDSALVANRNGLLVLTPDTPLVPGTTVRVGFSYTVQQPRGLSRNGGGRGTFILPAGVVLSTRRGGFLPIPGFVDRKTEADPASLEAGSAGFNHGQPFTTRLAVRAPEAYTVNSVGEKRSETSANGYTTVVWESAQPVRAINLVAGKWDVRERDGAAVFHHAGHSRNADEMLGTMLAARDAYANWFGPYPWNALRLSEYPDLETNATAFPTNISFSEGIGFRSSGSRAQGLTFSVVAHEVAHQWWGHLVAAGTGPGTGLLVEGMANFATLRLHNAVRGDSSRQQYARQLERNYLDARPARDEPSVLAARETSAGNEAILSYRGALVLWMLREEMGAEAFDAQLRGYATSERERGTLAEPRALLAQLRAGAPDTVMFDAFVAQWFDDAVLPEFTVTVRDVAFANGQWTTVADVRNVGTGTVSVQVAAQRNGPLPGTSATSLQLHDVLVSAGASVPVVFTSTESPSRLTVDPYVRVLQLNRSRATAAVNAPSRVAMR